MRIISTIMVSLLILLVPANVLAETAGQKQLRETGFAVQWIDVGIAEDKIHHVRITSDGKGDLYIIDVILKDGSIKSGFVNEKGSIVLPVIYDDAYFFSNGLAYTELNNRKMFIDITGKEVIDVSKYDRASSFDGDFALIYLNNRCGIIDKYGKVVIECKHDHISRLSDVLFSVQTDGKHILKNRFDVNLSEIEFDNIGMVVNGRMSVSKDGKWGFINTDGEIVIPLIYNSTKGFRENAASVSLGEKWGYINPDGGILVDFKFDDAGVISDGFGWVQVGDKFGFIDINGKITIPCEYDFASSFYDGKARVGYIVGGKTTYYYIDKTGKTVLGPKDYPFYNLGNMYMGFHSDLFGTNINPQLDYSRRYALLDGDGNRLTGFSFYFIGEPKSGLITANYVEYPENLGSTLFKTGLINEYGSIILPTILDKIEILDSNTCFVQISDPETDDNDRVGILTLPADSSTRKPLLSERSISVYLDGLDLYFDTEPIIVNGRTLVPMRKIFETLGAEVTWDGAARKVLAVKGDRIVELVIGNSEAFVNGERFSLDVPATIQGDRTLVPLRFVAESLNCDVKWVAENHRVVITADNKLQ